MPKFLTPKFLLSLVLKLSSLAVAIGLVLYLVACGYLYLRQTHLIFRPVRQLDVTPADFERPFQEVWLSVSSSVSNLASSSVSPQGTSDRIHGWWLPAAQPDANVLLYLHGNASNLSANAEHASRLNRLGFSVLIIDYRGYGKSDGDVPTEQGVYLDAQTAWNYLTQVRQIPPEKIFIYGHSLGGAIAIQLASQTPQAAGLIVESSFTSMTAVIRRTAAYNIFPIELILTQKFDSIDRVPALKMPVLFIHGGQDDDVPTDMSAALYQAAPNPKFLYIVPQAGHSNTASIGGEEYLRVVREFVQKSETRGRAALN